MLWLGPNWIKITIKIAYCNIFTFWSINKDELLLVWKYVDKQFQLTYPSHLQITSMTLATFREKIQDIAEKFNPLVGKEHTENIFMSNHVSPFYPQTFHFLI